MVTAVPPPYAETSRPVTAADAGPSGKLTTPAISCRSPARRGGEIHGDGEQRGRYGARCHGVDGEVWSNTRSTRRVTPAIEAVMAPGHAGSRRGIPGSGPSRRRIVGHLTVATWEEACPGRTVRPGRASADCRSRLQPRRPSASVSTATCRDPPFLDPIVRQNCHAPGRRRGLRGDGLPRTSRSLPLRERRAMHAGSPP